MSTTRRQITQLSAFQVVSVLELILSLTASHAVLRDVACVCPSVIIPSSVKTDKPKIIYYTRMILNMILKYADGLYYPKLLAICRPSGCTVGSVASGVVPLSALASSSLLSSSSSATVTALRRTSKCTCLIFGMSVGLDPG